MNELSLFSGAGGGLLGSALLGWRTVAAVEINPYCREVLLRRQLDGVLPMFPIWDDARTFDGTQWAGRCDVVSAGFPCQPFSIAGKQAAEDDPRNMWPDTARILGEVQPRFALLENVPGLLTEGHGYLWRILADLTALGFDAVWDCFPASSVGAPHKRDRLFILAYAHGIRQLQQEGPEQNERGWAGYSCKESRIIWWASEPNLGRVAHGVASRMDRIKALGNGQVPAVVVSAWNHLNRKMEAQCLERSKS